MSKTTSNPAPESEELPLLFCPFCRECYEGEKVCPVHELPLVDFIELPKQAHERETVHWDQPVKPWDVRFGRGWIALGAIVSAVGFFLPFATVNAADQETTWTAMHLANSAAPNLWSVPFAAALFVSFLYRRQTPLQMRGARLASLLLALTPVISVAYTMRNIVQGVANQHGATAVSWEPGLYVIGVGALLLAYGAVRFGTMPDAATDPHGAVPERDDERGIDTGRVSGPPKKRRRR
ncbi:MAG: hypothetical protein AB8I08_06790 [Sandaracinaceae bacterium]